MTNVCIITQGCAANMADSEVMAALLSEAGYMLVKQSEEADVVVINTCTVKGPTENLFKRLVKKFEAEKKIVIIAGCIPQGEKSHTSIASHPVVGTHQISKIVNAVEAGLEGKTAVFLGLEESARLNVHKIRKNPFVEIVPILQGCLGHCNYCKTKHARGHLRSYPVEQIVRHISNAVKDGAREIWLTSQDCGAYGLDIGTDLSSLLRSICSIRRDFKVRVGMGNPEHVREILENLIQAYKDEKMYKFLHIPVQSGSDKVLKEMGREYTTKDFLTIVRRFREKIPDITISTDIIFGYPTETEEDFQQTLELIKQARPDVFNISRFWPRPGTPAERLKPLSSEILRRRTVLGMALLRKIAAEKNRGWIGWEGNVMIVENGKRGTVIGRNNSYRPIVIPGEPKLVGGVVKIRVIGSTAIDLRAKILK